MSTHRQHSIDEIEPLDAYLAEIAQYENLSAEQERHLARRAQHGDVAALDEFVKHYLRLVVSIAKKYQNQGLEMPDLVGAGNIGLIEAAKRYDPDNSRFTTYATWWIKQSIGRAVESQGRAIRLPSYVAQEVRYIKLAHTTYLNENGQEPTIEQVAEATGLKIDRILEINIACGVVSLNRNRMNGENSDSDESSSIADMLGSGDEDMDRAIEKMELREAIDNALCYLSAREREIIELRFGLIDGKTRSLEEIARGHGVTRERIRQIEAKGIRKLHRSEDLRRLCDGTIEEKRDNRNHRHPAARMSKQQKAGETKRLMRTGYKRI